MPPAALQVEPVRGRKEQAPAESPALSPEMLYASHFSFVWRNLRRMGVPEQLLEDAAQDVFMAVHQRFHTYDATRAAIETWLFGILFRVASYHRRTLRRRLARIVPWSKLDAPQSVAAEGDSPAELVAKRQAARLLDELLARLDADKRAVLVLVDVEQFSVPQAAEALHINLNTAYWRLREGRIAFQRALARTRAASRGKTGGSSHERG